MADSCIYTRIDGSSILILLIWVDDILICSNNKNDLISVKQILSDRFRMKDLGILRWFFGNPI